MMTLILRKLRALALLGTAAFAIILSSCQMCPFKTNCTEDDDCHGHAKVCHKPTVRALAHDLDTLESHIERYGSIVIQHPAVWGQARLTKHREEFEKVMVSDLCKFEATLQGALSRSDQAYFANSVALGVAAGGPQAMVSQAQPPANANFILQPQTTPTPDPLAPITITQNDARLPAARSFDTIGAKGITLEPSVYLNQKARYLNHLHELRRINEGDDTADSPGYALNLIRVPVSVLPGKHTQEGYGGEVTMTLKPHLSEELLPTTFRNLVMNDLLEQIGVPLTQFLNDKEQVKSHLLTKEAIDEALAEKKAKTRSEVKFEDLLVRSKAQILKDPNFQKSLQRTREILPSEANEIQLENAFKRYRESKLNVNPIVPATKLRHARRPFPPSQLLEIYGGEVTRSVALRAFNLFSQDVPNKYWIHYPDVQGYLQEELAGAYRFLADPNHSGLWSHCSQDLVSAVHTRKIETIASLRDQYARQVKITTKRDMTDDITVALAWAILVESALLTDHLQRDMKEAAAAKNCPCPATDWMDYYMPQPSAEARQAFNRYVECRWPVIVFALDPVADQQNIADSFSSRREMQLAMSMAFVSGKLSAKNMMKFARRLETEMETVSLNNTVTGFSHGNETFGWRFYPRFQTPDTESNITVLFRDQLIGGPNRNALLKQRKLEPGQRECTAIVIMPSFIPYATLETSSTWFKLSNPKNKDMTCVDAVKLSARVKAIENCSPMVSDANCYRDGELNRLINRAKQLEARLPLQSAKVQIPYENTLGGFAMFNTGITDLAPELYGWYGAPGVNTHGNTTLFLIGNHFSVHQTKVVVGGVHVTDTEMLSRQVMRVTIPAGALTLDRDTGTFHECPPLYAVEKQMPTVNGEKVGTAEDGEGANPKADASKPAAACICPNMRKELFVSVHIATPYGVTSHLLIPACGATTCPPAAPVAPAAPPPALPCAKVATGSTAFFCPDESAIQKKAADDAKARRLTAETANKAASKALKDRKDAADLQAAKDLAKAVSDYSAQSAKEQADYRKAVKEQLDELKKALDKKQAENGERMQVQQATSSAPIGVPQVSWMPTPASPAERNRTLVNVQPSAPMAPVVPAAYGLPLLP